MSQRAGNLYIFAIKFYCQPKIGKSCVFDHIFFSNVSKKSKKAGIEVSFYFYSILSTIEWEKPIKSHFFPKDDKTPSTLI